MLPVAMNALRKFGGRERRAVALEVQVTRSGYARFEMSNCERGVNEAERWFERYLCDHDYESDYEPDLGVSTRPDFLVCRNGVELVCEVKGFETPTPLDRKVAGVDHPVMLSADEEYGPMRGAVREAARQLKPLAGSDRPLIVVLANPMDFRVNLNIDRLVEAMYGNPGYAGTFKPDEGQVDDLEFFYEKDGRLRNDHPYISGVAILRERPLALEYYDEWRAKWKAGRPALPSPSTDEIVAEFLAEQAAWRASEEAKNVPEGNVYLVDLLTTGSPEAAPVPENTFDGPRDRRTDVQRV